MLPVRWAVNCSAWAPSEAQLALVLQWCLPPEEAARCKQFRQPADQRRAVVSQVLQRACIARLLDSTTAWRELPVKRTRGGKPFYAGAARRAGAPNLNYNVSHEGDFVILACEGRCLCGADVAAPQQLRSGTRPLPEVLGLMQGQLTANEWAHFQSLAGDEAAMESAFQAIWSCKEAFIKARGDGVAFELSRLEVQLPACGPQGWAAQPVQRAALLVDGEPQPRWRAFLQQLPNRHWAAVVRGPPDAAIDAWQAFVATFREPDMPPDQLQQALDAPSPPFDLLAVEDVLPDELLGRYLQAA